MFGGSIEAQRSEFGELIHTPKHEEGVCGTNEIAGLVSHCGCKDESGALLKPSTLPFVGSTRRDGQKWQLRIEPLAAHVIGDGMVQGHRWIFALAAGGEDQNR